MTSEGPAEGNAGRPALVEAGRLFMRDRALRLGAGLAYYGLITMLPLLVLLIGIMGLLLGEEAASGDLARSLEARLGTEVAMAVADLVQSVDAATSFTNLTIFSIAALIFTASVLFVAWKDALNVIWGIEYRGGVKQTLVRRLFGLAVVGGVAALVVALFIAQSVLAMLSNLFSDEAVLDTALRVTTSLVPAFLSGLLLALLYRYGPDREVPWRWVWSGTVVSIVLVLVLTWGYGIYVDATSSSAAGVASSALLLIVLVYGIAQVLLFGAEVVKVHGLRHGGGRAEPSV